MKNKLIFLVAILIGGLAFMLNWQYLSKERAALYAGAEKVKIIVAQRDLPASTVLTIDDLALNDVFASNVGRDAFFETDLDSLLGKKMKYSARRGDPLRWSQVDMPRRTKTGLSHTIEKGKRAISLSIAGAPAVSGLVQPNDNVDIVGTFTFPSRTNPKNVESVTLTLMQNVTVIATGAQIAGQSSNGRGSQGGYSMVTFEVSPREAEVLIFAQQTRGQLYLTLRNPDDIYYEEELPSVNFELIETMLLDLNAQRQQEIRSIAP